MHRLILSAAIVFAADQASKLAVLRGLNLAEVGRVEIFPPYLVFSMAWNRGVNFGLFANDAEVTRWVLVGVSLTISVFLVRWAAKLTASWAHILAGIIVGGALGNAVDRVIYGAVADFLNMSCCGIRNPFAFNIADVAIFVGAFGLVFWSNRLEKAQ